MLRSLLSLPGKNHILQVDHFSHVHIWQVSPQLTAATPVKYDRDIQRGNVLIIPNKENLRDLIAAKCCPVILLKLDSNHRLFSPCDLEIWWMTLKNNRAPLLYSAKLCVSFQSHRWIQTGVTARNRSSGVKIDNFLSRVTLKFYG